MVVLRNGPETPVIYKKVRGKGVYQNFPHVREDLPQMQAVWGVFTDAAAKTIAEGILGGKQQGVRMGDHLRSFYAKNGPFVIRKTLTADELRRKITDISKALETKAKGFAARSGLIDPTTFSTVRRVSEVDGYAIVGAGETRRLPGREEIFY